MKLFRITWGILAIGILLMSSFTLADDGMLLRQKLENANAMEAVAIANEWKWSHKDVTTSVTAREVIFEFPDKTVKKIPLPQEKMLVAVAPYIRQTHKWTTHFMSSCQGELAGKSFYVTAVDQEGNMLVNGTVSTLRNGFFELWLPRKRIIDLRIQGFNRVAQGKITTYDSSKTCVTTFRLH